MALYQSLFVDICLQKILSLPLIENLLKLIIRLRFDEKLFNFRIAHLNLWKNSVIFGSKTMVVVLKGLNRTAFKGQSGWCWICLYYLVADRLNNLTGEVANS